MNDVALRANDVLRNDVMLRINDVALCENGFFTFLSLFFQFAKKIKKYFKLSKFVTLL